MGKKNGTERHANRQADQALLTETKETKDEVIYEVSETEHNALRYTLTEIPPIPVSVFVALQHVLVSLASALTMSSIIADMLCADLNHSIRARLFATTLFMQGICTITQTLLGVRLPVFQGPSSSFLVPLIALNHNPGWVCDVRYTSHTDTVDAMGNDTAFNNATLDSLPPGQLTLEDKLQQLSGSLMVSSLVEVVIGGLGIIRPLLRHIGPITVAPTIALIGLSLFKLPVIYAKYNPPIALGSCALVVIFSLYMSKITIPLPSCGKGDKPTKLPLFQLLPILLAMVLMWGVCGILTLTDAVPDDKDHPFYYSRTDAKLSIIENTPWFQITYPGDASPDHAMSRGILVEGLGSLLSGAVGAAHATTSYSGNIAMLSLTKTASRSVLVLAGLMLVTLSLIGKVGACMATLPPPILGGILLVVMGMLATLGISTLKYADMTSNRNLLITGVAFMSGLSVPAFVETHGDMIATGNENADQVIRVVLGTPMFLGGIIALILDNTVPGTEIERGIIGWKMSHSAEKGHEKQNGGHAGQGGDDDQHSAPLLNGSDDKPAPNEDGEPEKQSTKTSGVKGRELTEDEIYAFQPLKGALSSPVWRFVPFIPPTL